MKNLDVIIIDNTNYLVVKEAKYNNTSYLFLANENDEDDTLIRKTIAEDKNTVIPLEDEKEFELACNLFLKNTLI